MAKTKITPNDFIKQKLGVTPKDIPEFDAVLPRRRKPVVQVPDDFADIAWKTWCQECKWRGHPKGKTSINVLRKLAQDYSVSDIELYVRASMLMGVRHTYSELNYFKFSHLASEACRQAYQNYLDGAEHYVKMSVSRVGGPISKLLIALRKKASGKPILVNASAERINTYLLALSKSVAQECMRYSAIKSSGVFDYFSRNDFALVNAYLTEFTQFIYGADSAVIYVGRATY